MSLTNKPKPLNKKESTESITYKKGDIMELELTKKPKNVIVIEGFPGFGLVGTITTEFLLDHLETEKIGRFYFESGPATLAVHGQKIVEPISIHYNKKYNLVIIHSLTSATGLEWKAADIIAEVCSLLNATKLICIEGIGSMDTQQRTFYFTNEATVSTKIEKTGLLPLSEGIIVGVTSAIMLKAKLPTLCLFAETKSNMPDSKAAADIILKLDKLLGLNVDPKPLLKQAELFEQKIKGIMEQAKKTHETKDKKELNYMG